MENIARNGIIGMGLRHWI